MLLFYDFFMLFVENLEFSDGSEGMLSTEVVGGLIGSSIIIYLLLSRLEIGITYFSLRFV